VSLILVTQEADIRRIIVQSQHIVHETLSWKYSIEKRAGGMA
jgi:hypothetical protein